MELLIVRTGLYIDRRKQAVIDVITRLWERITIPDGVKVVTAPTPPLWRTAKYRYNAFLYYKYWRAWQEWKECPAPFLAITDIDVFPTNNNALYALRDYLRSLPGHIGMVTREPINCMAISNARNFIGSLAFTPSEGLLVVMRNYIPTFLLHQTQKYLTLCNRSNLDYIFANEGQVGDNLPPIPTVCFPSHILTIIFSGIHPTSYDIIKTTAFIHIAGDTTQAMGLIWHTHMNI